MPTRNVSLTPELDREVAKLVKSGKYPNASAVVRAALKALKHELVQQRKQQRLIAMLEEGDRSGISEDYSLEKILEEAGIRRRKVRRSA